MWLCLIVRLWAAQNYLEAGDRYLALGHYESAQRCYEEAQSREPRLRSDWSYLIRQGTAEFYLGQGISALPPFRRAVDWGMEVAQRAEAWYWLGRVFFELEDYRSAGRSFTQAIELSPNPKLLYPFGITCYKDQRYRDAFNLLENLYELDQGYDPNELRYLLGLSALKLGDYPTASFYLGALKASEESWYWDDGIWLQALVRYQLGDRVGALQLISEFGEKFGPKLKERAFLLFGTIQFELSDYEAAQKTFESMLAESKSIYRADLLFRAGTAAMSAGNNLQAIQHFSELLQSFPGSEFEAPALFYGAQVQSQLGNFADATQLYRSLFFYYPQHPYQEDALWGLSDAYFRLNDYFSAAQELENFVNSFPESPHRPEALYHLSTALSELGRNDEALHWLDELIADHPKGLVDRANYLKGKILMDRGQFGLARRSFSKVWGELRSRAIKGIADSYYREGSYRQALASYKKLIDTQISDELKSEAQYQEELCRFHLGEYHSQAEAIKHFLLQYPDSKLAPQVQLELGLYYYDRGEFALAVREFEDFLIQYPRSPLTARTMVLLGDAELKLGNQAAALIAYDQLIHEFPKSNYAAQAYMGLGQAYLELGRHQEARIMLERLCKLYPDSPFIRAARLGITRSYRLESQFKKAQSELNDYFRRFGPTPDGHREQGELWKAQGRLREALKSFKAAAELWGSARDEAAQDLLTGAECARLIGDIDEARSLLIEASSRAQDERLRAEARRRLSQIEGR